jgi:hypothetical protein
MQSMLVHDLPNALLLLSSIFVINNDSRWNAASTSLAQLGSKQSELSIQPRSSTLEKIVVLAGAVGLILLICCITDLTVATATVAKQEPPRPYPPSFALHCCCRRGQGEVRADPTV